MTNIIRHAKLILRIIYEGAFILMSSLKIQDLKVSVANTSILKGLNLDDSKEVLGNPAIDPDSLKKIHLITRGNPRVLTQLREGDEIALRGNTRLSKEETSLLLFLRTVESGD